MHRPRPFEVVDIVAPLRVSQTLAPASPAHINQIQSSSSLVVQSELFTIKLVVNEGVYPPVNISYRSNIKNMHFCHAMMFLHVWQKKAVGGYF